MVLELVSPQALGRALGIEAGTRHLPVTARSLTAAERRAPALREIGWMILVYLLFGLACLAVIRLATTNPRVVDWLPVVAILAGGAIAIMAWRKLAPHRAYRDPGIEVEVGEEAVTVRSAGGTEIISHAEIAVTNVLIRTPRNSVYFDGIVLETANGPLRLGDEGFAGGNVAAGAILKKLDERETATAHAA